MSTSARGHAEYEDHFASLDEMYDQAVQDCQHEWEPLPLLGEGWRRCRVCWLAEEAEERDDGDQS